MPFQMHEGAIIQWDTIKTANATGPGKTVRAKWYAIPDNKKNNTNFSYFLLL